MTLHVIMTAIKRIRMAITSLGLTLHMATEMPLGALEGMAVWDLKVQAT